MNSLESRIVTATKWSALTEIASKLISPIAGMILARLLTPEAYGAVATTTIIISFAELFTDAGFQKYIIQHNFEDTDDRNKSVNVAFWSNMVMSLIIWAIIIVFRSPIAQIVGSPGLETAIVVACVAIPLNSFASIQKAIFKRSLNFRTPFIARVIGLIITFFITIPLAIWLRSYWALIISKIVNCAFAAVFFTIKSNWNPSLYYSFKRLKQMLSFCSLLITNSVLTWFTTYIDIFIVSRQFDQHTLGIYKTSITRANSALAIISASIIPLLLPTFSKLKDDLPQLRNTMLKMQKYLSVILLPTGFILFLYSDIITRIYLGSQWTEAAPLIGTWALIHSFSLLISRFCSNTYVAIGKPHISLLLQILFAAILIPTVLIAVNYGFQTLFVSRTFTKLWLIIMHLITIYLLIKQSPFKIIGNILPELLGCIIMTIMSYALGMVSNSSIWQVISMLICLTTYFGILLIQKQERAIVSNLWKHTTSKINLL